MKLYRYYNPNPYGKLVGDCSIRAVSIALSQGWKKTYKEICSLGLMLGDMPSSNAVWGTYLQDHGFHREIIPNSCPNCYSIREFCLDNPVGTFVLCTGTHVVTAIDGDYYDSWDSGDEVPVYLWRA